MTPLENAKSTISNMKAPNNETRIWLGIAAGIAVGLGVAISRRKKTRWERVRELPQRVTEKSGDLAEATRDLAGRVAHLYSESRGLVEDAGRLWSNGRKLVRH